MRQNSSAEDGAVQAAQNKAATACGSVAAPNGLKRGGDIAPWRAEYGAEYHRVLVRKYFCGSGAAMR